MFSSFPKKTHEIKSELSESIKNLSRLYQTVHPQVWTAEEIQVVILLEPIMGKGVELLTNHSTAMANFSVYKIGGSKKESIAHTRQTNPGENGSSPESSDGRSEGPALASAC